MAQYRMRPRKKKQALADSCWAATLDEFTRITAGVGHMSESGLVGTWGTGATGGLNAANLAGLHSSTLALNAIELEFEASPVMPYAVEDRLETSHVILIRHISGTAWHAWLVYGIDNWVLYMDPRDGEYHRMYWASSHFTSGPGYYFIWRP